MIAPDADALALDLGDRAARARLGQLDRAPVVGDVVAGRRAPVDELERAVAERVGQREPERAVGLGVVEALDQLADGAGARVAAAHQAGQEGEGQDGEGDEGQQARRRRRSCPAARATSMRKAMPSSATSASPVHSIGASARRWGGVAAWRLRTSSTSVDDQHGDGDEGRRCSRRRRPGRARRRSRRRCPGAGPSRSPDDVAAEQEVGQAHGEDVEVAGGDRHALGEGLQPPRREREHHLDDEHQVERLDVAADREDRRVVGLGQPGEEPGDPDAGHQQPEAVERAPPPGEDAGADEAQPDERAEDGGDDLLVLVRRRQREGDVEAREDHPEGEEGEQGAAQAEHGGPRAARLWLRRRDRPWR